MLTDIVRPHHTAAQLDLLKGYHFDYFSSSFSSDVTQVVLDNRKAWYDAQHIPDQDFQTNNFGKWKMIHRW